MQRRKAFLVEPSTSPYTSPISNKDGKCQFYVDYRRLNAITEEAASSMPTIPATLCDLGQAKVFSIINLRSVYWQIPLTERLMPFGFKNAPANFQYGGRSFGQAKQETGADRTSVPTGAGPSVRTTNRCESAWWRYSTKNTRGERSSRTPVRGSTLVNNATTQTSKSAIYSEFDISAIKLNSLKECFDNAELQYVKILKHELT